MIPRPAFRQLQTCAVGGCDRKPNARDLCKMHYQRWLTHGSTDLVEPEPDLPNPWVDVAPSCPEGHEPAEVYLWHPKPEDGLGRWFCSPCGKRFKPNDPPIGSPTGGP